MQLWIVRHAIAADLSAEILTDYDRPLTDKGRRKFRVLAQALAMEGYKPDLILSSPLLRAVQTAEILRDSMKLPDKQVEIEPMVGPGVDLARVLDSMRDREPVEALAIVGHEPDMSRNTSLLIGGGQVDFGKGNIACIEFDRFPSVGSGRLRWFVRPGLVDG